LRAMVLKKNIVCCSIPEDHSFRETWSFRLGFEGGVLLEFSSASTEVVGWQEVGSLNVQKMDDSKAGAIGRITTFAKPFRVSELEKVVYEDDDVISECGMAFHGGVGEPELVVAAGISPGSVSVAGQCSDEGFAPQFAISTCRREKII